MHVVAAIDDDPGKSGSRIMGVRVVGGRDKIPFAAEKYATTEAVIAIPSATKKQIAEIIAMTNQTSMKVRTLPSLMNLIDGRVSVKALRDVEIDDLLGRDPVSLDMSGITDFIRGKTVLVTGGGGSIGSELCRQISEREPKTLLILDEYENSVFFLEHELRSHFPELKIVPSIVSVCDTLGLESVFEEYRPQVIFHAAAHKHVPLMEANPAEAVKNNVFGTKNTVDMAERYGAEKFVMISTDKAVEPSSVMGATKRLAEMVVQEKNKISATSFCSVRFGNVLGSNGSVIPFFRNQIEAGGPVTVTHKDVTRYFMTIPEAVQLVMQAGAMATGGEMFILDMGEPVRIMDLAETMVRLSGFTPYEDIDIVVTQLRPGEKLHEKLNYASEDLARTSHDKIFLGHQAEPSDRMKELLRADAAEADELFGTLSGMDGAGVRGWISERLPEYRP
jgi:FlaA1/EpsC-like NDP-sugar epimerase